MRVRLREEIEKRVRFGKQKREAREILERERERGERHKRG